MDRYPKSSPYGDYRLEVPMTQLIPADSNFYFFDSFCHMTSRSCHYINIAIAKPGSKADVLLATVSKKLQPGNNPFSRMVQDRSGILTFSVASASNLWVELIITEPTIVIGSHHKISVCQVVRNRGYSRPHLPNNPRCPQCN